MNQQEFVDEVIRLSFAIERTVASDLGNPYCSSARVMAEQLHKLANQQSSSRPAPTCAICGEIAERHHPQDGGHEFNPGGKASQPAPEGERKSKECPVCHGRGTVSQNARCLVCNGTGVAARAEE